jgi:superfamily I DNA and/or RNA helicase
LSIGEALELYVNEISTFPAVDAVVREYTAVHAATCQRSALYLDNPGYQNVIVDEAARVNPTDLLIPLVQATTRVILVGDHRQLPATFDENIARGVSESDLLQTSLFERLFVLLQKVGNSTGIPRTVTLNTQYRMHPRLGDFVSKHFYEPYGETLENGLPEERFQHRIPGFESRTSVWVDIPLERGSAQRSPSRSWFRETEAIEVARIASQIVRENPDLSVGVITFYSAQKNLILENLDEEHVMRDELGHLRVADEYSLLTDSSGKSHERLRIGSVDAFQGKEFDVVILSLVRSQKMRSSDSARELYGFASVENRMCVALSRQKKLLIVVGDKAMAASENARDVTGLHGLVELCDLEEKEFNQGLVG